MPDGVSVNLERSFRLCDACMARRYSAAWEHMLRGETLRLLAALSKGDRDTLSRFAHRMLRDVPEAEVCA